MDLPIDYMTTFYKVEETGGGYDPNTGKWVPGTSQDVPVEGMIMPLSNDDLRFDEAGTYTRHDRKAYVKEPLKIGQEVKYKGHTYRVHEEKDYSDLAGIYIYFLRRVGG